jgi:protein phosphatase
MSDINSGEPRAFWQYDGACACGSVRQANEDGIRIMHEVVSGGKDGRIAGQCPAGGPFLAVVADGMGGHALGETASDHVLRCLDPVLGTAVHDVEAAIRQALNEAHRTLCGMLTEEHGVPGSTVVGVYEGQGVCFAFHAGDSRLYRLEQGGLVQLTKDHTLQALYGGNNRNVLYNCVGGGGLDLEVVVTPIGFLDGTVLVLVSDGVYDGLTDQSLFMALKEGKPAPEILKLAFDSGSQDNASIIILKWSVMP